MPIFIDEFWEDISIVKYICEIISENSIHPFGKFFSDNIDEIIAISDAIDQRRKKGIIVYPPTNYVFRAFSTPITNIKVLILGQDCYHDGAAVGLCFSVGGSGAINPSLRNILKELKDEGLNTPDPENPCSLVPWAKRGCMLLNTALTVEKGKPESHLEIWKDFTTQVIKEIAKAEQPIAWLLMGAKAAAFATYAPVHHKTFITSHPSPFSANKPFRNYPAFLGSGVFLQINNFLKEKIFM